MKTGQMFRALMIAAMWLSVGAWAQDYPPQQTPASPDQTDATPVNYSSQGDEAPVNSEAQPNVARLSLIYGDVSMLRGDTGDWASTSVNAPLVHGDQVATGDKSRAEIQLDYANILRIAAKSQIKIADLTRTHIQIQVAQGYASYTMLKGSEADTEIDSPNVAVRPLKQGRYRVQVNSESETDVIVREGEAEIITPQGSTRVREGDMITVRGTDNPEYRVSAAPGKDDWDRWNRDRDGEIRDASSWGRTNRYYTGTHDLDTYGHWVYVPGYGWVWSPYQQAAWAPYQAGRWVWEPYYGWTWVSYEPWGWAPYHYGRWFFYSGNWCWWPGPVYVHYRPLWSPAFVFFVGFGHRSGFGFGSIGWFPVGPHDAFYPWYGRGFNRVNVVNVTNINIVNVNRGTFVAPLAVRGRHPYYSNANLVLTNPRVRGSITTVSTEDFGHGKFDRRRYGVEEHEWREAKVMTANVPVVPTRESLRTGSAGTHMPEGFQPRNTDRFYTRHQPSAGPESFHDQLARVRRVVGPEAGAAGTQGNVRTDFHNGQGQVERRDGGPQNSPGHMSDATKGELSGRGTPGGNMGQEDRKDGFHRMPGHTNDPNGPQNSPGRMSDVTKGELSGHSTPGGNMGQEERKDNRDRGWTKFGPPSGGGSSGQTVPRTGDSGRMPRTDNPAETRRGNDGPNWQKFPTAGGPGNDQQGGDRGNTPTRTQDGNRDWQRLPQHNDGPKPSDLPANRNGRIDPGDHSSGGNNKPPLDLKRPIVTPRQDEPRYTPPPQRTPQIHNEPRYTPPPQHNEPRYSPPQHNEPRYSPPQRSEPRYSPPSHSESHSNSSSSHSGSGDRGSHSDSKSSSNPKQR